jgi:hypothetical protein
LRKVHFLVEFCWNNDVYKPILKYLSKHHGLSPVDVLLDLCTESADGDLAEFWQHFDEVSKGEWFDSAEEIEAFFADSKNFDRLLNGDFDKLNILFSIIALRDFKLQFDAAIRGVLARVMDDGELATDCANLTFARFPSLRDSQGERVLVVVPGIAEIFDFKKPLNGQGPLQVLLKADGKRTKVMATLDESDGLTISKILNTQGISLRDLSMTVSILPDQQVAG